jgi:diguanylate cyclase (GGDEF)-like protein
MRNATLQLVAGACLILLSQVGMFNAGLILFTGFGWKFVAPELLMIASGFPLSVGVVLVFRYIKTMRESKRRLELLAQMNMQVNREILLNEEIELIYRTILNCLFSVFKDASSGSILILGKDKKLTFAASRGFNDSVVENFRMRLKHSLLFQFTEGAIKETRLIRASALSELELEFELNEMKIQSVISAPIFMGDQMYGLLNLYATKDGIFGIEDVETVDRFKAQIEVILLARERYQESIKRYQVDALTGLYTRRYFEELFRTYLERAIRHKESFVIAMFDLDKLKYVNDTFGHLSGDQMLLTVANSLRSTSRASDMIARFGGDEFIALYPLTGKLEMDSTLARTRSKVRASRLNFGDVQHSPSFSYGLALFPDDGTDLESLIAHADSLLYEMKTQKSRGFLDTLPFGLTSR